MMKKSCPNPRELQDLLEGSVADSEQAAMVTHLDECTCCQKSLEGLASSDSSFRQTLLEQPALYVPEANSAYWPALQQAERALHRADWAPPRAPKVSLDFLRPPADGSNLGTMSHFDIVRLVGRGGMGVVLHAVDTRLQRDVAVKVLDPDLAKDDLARKRFCREARAAASITHENVVAVHQVEHEEGSDLPFLVMELISGESLEKKLDRDGPLPLREIVRIGMQTASGLAAAHEKGLIHRDIKPGNILLEQSGQRVKLTDFGLARLTEDVRLTSTGSVAGTPLYMSPEQASGAELDARSDLFSLGVVLYELAAGEPPFNGKTPLTVLKKLTEEKHRPLRELNPELPEWFTHIVDRLLAKKPQDRFQSAHELADTLEHFWALLRSSSETPNAVCAKKKAAHIWKTVILGVAAGLTTLAIGIAAFVFFMPQQEKPDSAIRPPAHMFDGNAGPLWSMAISRDGKKLAMGMDDGTVKLWDIAADKVDWALTAHKGTIWSLALSPTHLATGSDDGPAKIWDLSTRQDMPLKNSAGARALAFDAEGKKVLVGGRDGSVKVWNALTREELLTTTGHGGSLVGAVAFAPNGKTMASASGDKTIKVWDAVSGKENLTLRGHQAGVYGIAYSPNSRYLVSGSWDKTVRLWDLDSGGSIGTLAGPTQDVWSVDFNSKGTLIASTGEDQMVRIWDFESKRPVATFRGSTGAILNVRFIPEGGFLAAGGKDGSARIWNLNK